MHQLFSIYIIVKQPISFNFFIITIYYIFMTDFSSYFFKYVTILSFYDFSAVFL